MSGGRTSGRFGSGGRGRPPERARRALAGIALACLLAGPAAAEGPPDREGESGWSRADRIGRTGYDLLILRPFQLGQLVLSAVVFLPSYPISFLFDGDEDVMEACITDPYARVFQRSLGDL